MACRNSPCLSWYALSTLSPPKKAPYGCQSVPSFCSLYSHCVTSSRPAVLELLALLLKSLMFRFRVDMRGLQLDIATHTKSFWCASPHPPRALPLYRHSCPPRCTLKGKRHAVVIGFSQAQGEARIQKQVAKKTLLLFLCQMAHACQYA